MSLLDPFATGDAALLAKPDAFDREAHIEPGDILALLRRCDPVVLQGADGVAVVRCAVDGCQEPYPCQAARVARYARTIGAALGEVLHRVGRADQLAGALAAQITLLRDLHTPQPRPGGPAVCPECLVTWPCPSAELLFAGEEIARAAND